MGRYFRQGMMTHSMVSADLGWRVDWIDVPGAAADYTHRFPNVTLAADGLPCPEHARSGHTSRNDPVCIMCSRCFSAKGRGMSIMDLVRRVVRNGLVQFEWISLKSASIGADGKLPSWLGLSTGNFSTLLAIQEALASGTPLPTLVWASAKGSEVGYALALDLAPIIRENGVVPITQYPESGWGRGQAPAAWHRWASWQSSGQKKAAVLAELGMEIPKGSVWTGEAEWAAGQVRYPQLTVGISQKALAKLGVSWYQQVHVSELAAFAELHLDWKTL